MSLDFSDNPRPISQNPARVLNIKCPLLSRDKIHNMRLLAGRGTRSGGFGTSRT